MTSTNYDLPLLDGTFDVGRDEYVEIALDDYKLTYFVKYPSGYFREGLSTEECHRELKRLIPNDEKREHVIRYATDKRRTAFFPKWGKNGVQYIMFPGSENRIYFGGGANSGGIEKADPFVFINIDDITPESI